MGIADNVEVEMELEVPDRRETGSEWQIPFTLNLAYVAPNQRVRYLIASVSNAIPYLNGRITAIRYTNLYGVVQMGDAHGSTAFRLELKDTEMHVTNQRAVVRATGYGGVK